MTDKFTQSVKDLSETLVSASSKVSVLGESVLIEGSVMDIASGTKQPEQSARFPSGVPAVSDNSMTKWMEYIYQQQPRPTDTIGVDVTLSVVDPNGNIYDIDTVATDSTGMFKKLLTPEVPGEYTIIAMFDGSTSYYPSYAQTAIGVSDAPHPTATATPPPTSMTDTYVLASTAAIIIAIAIVGLAIVMVVKKRP